MFISTYCIFERSTEKIAMSNYQSKIICIFAVSKMIEKEMEEIENDRKGKLKRMRKKREKGEEGREGGRGERERERERQRKERNIASFVIDSETINQWKLD